MEFGASSKSWGTNYIEDQNYFQNQKENQTLSEDQKEGPHVMPKTHDVRKVMHKNAKVKPDQHFNKLQVNLTQREEVDFEESALNRTVSDSRCKSKFQLLQISILQISILENSILFTNQLMKIFDFVIIQR